MKKIYEVGDTISFSEFAFDNKSGGTGMSHWEYDEKFNGIAFGIVTRAWDDYETGRRFWVKPLSKNLIDYIKRNASKEIVYVSEFDTI